MLEILGLIMIYTMGHTAVILFSRGWSNMTVYERMVSIVGVFTSTCLILDTMFNK